MRPSCVRTIILVKVFAVTQTATRDQMVSAADDLFYRQGYKHTSFADIADAVRISRGSFYHHFKSKDEILDAVILKRLADTQAMFDKWEKKQSPADRIKCYIQIVVSNWNKIRYFGCPVGTLSTELAKLNHASHDDARAIFALFREWLALQFRELGFAKDADAHAMYVLAWSQGVATLANAFQDERFVRREVRGICAWLDDLLADAAAGRRS